MPRTSRQPPRTRPATRPAFALALVVLLTLVVGLGLAVLFQRHGVAALASRRQADDYIARHAGLGMREMVSRWLTTVRGRLVESLDDDGLAFTLQFSDGQRVDVYFKDAQGTALANTSGLAGRRREIVELMKFYLEAQPEEKKPELLRQSGPTEISISTAPPEVLLALAQAIVGPDKAENVVKEIEQRLDDQLNDRRADAQSRAQGGIGSGAAGVGGAGLGGSSTASRAPQVDQILRGLTELQIEPAKISELQAMLVGTPTLWFATAELKGAGGRVLDRAGGLIEVNTAKADPFNQNGPFLTWDTLPFDEGSSTPSGR